MVNNMKTYIRQMAQIISVLLMIVLNSSCLTGGLDELESFDDTDLKNFQFEYRWERPLNETNPNNTQLGVVSLATDCKIEGDVIYCTITVPEAGNPSMFTESIRAQVSLDNIVGMATISTAATISPIGNAPILGKFGNFSNECKYVVTAVDGKTQKEWTVICKMIK